ncbi:hypothetical protein [Candidatus Uabimicrobium sp. HlEnr_7]|uniref:hypothetical protein n=1 Tax=Candidatus Uabimicrobium helgolandensis TaxID=3095367 RepID=UPI003556F17B
MLKFLEIIGAALFISLMVCSCSKAIEPRTKNSSSKPSLVTPIKRKNFLKENTQQKSNHLQIKTQKKILSKTNHHKKIASNGIKPGLNVSVSCPGIAFSGKRARVTIVIENTGNIQLSDVTIRGSFITVYGKPDSISFISAEGCASISDRLATWDVGLLGVGEKKEYPVVILCKGCKHCLRVTVNTAEGIHEQAECCTKWMGCLLEYRLLLECFDTTDSLAVSEETTYVIEVTHQGTSLHRNIKIEVIFPKEISPISGSGDSTCIIMGQRVTVIPYLELLPRRQIKWKIKGKAIQPGDARVRVYLTSGSLEELNFPPTTEEESTHVY